MSYAVHERLRGSRAAIALAILAISLGILVSSGLAQGRIVTDNASGVTALDSDVTAKVTGGGTVPAAPTYNTTIASFGVNARRPVGFTSGGFAEGRINYDRHRNSTGRHVNAPVTLMEAVISGTPNPSGSGGDAAIVGDCSLGSTCPPGDLSVVVYVEDKSDQGAGMDVFKIFFCSGPPSLPPPNFNGSSLAGCDGPEGGPLRTGNLQVRPDPGVVGETIATAGAAGVFSTTPTFNGVELAGGIYGVGVRTGSDSAYGDLHAEFTGISLIGLYQIISVDAWITSATIVGGTVTLGGTCTLDMGDGPPPTGGLSFAGTLTATGLSVTVGGTTIPTLPKTDGFTTIE
jgi:hypothetical protein